MEFESKDKVKVWMIDNQLGQRNLSVYARTELEWLKSDLLKVKAKANQGKRTDILPTLAKSKPLDVRKEVAKKANTSTGTADKVQHIMKKAPEEVKQKLRSGNETINRVYTDLKKKEQREEILEEVKQTPKLPKKDRKYKIIYADPAWKYFEGGNKNQSQHYKTMSIDDIKALEIDKLADDDCILFMWVTFPILKEVFEVMEAWGFEYSTCGFNWVKKNKKSDSWFFGLGSWTRSNSELCLIATKGKPIRFSASVSQIIDEPIEGHSKKPDCVRDKIVELCGDLPRIELFARKKTKGWDSWGNEI